MKRPLVKRIKVFKIKYFLIRTFLAPKALNKPTIFVRSRTKISKIEIIFMDEIMTIIENLLHHNQMGNLSIFLCLHYQYI